MKDKIIEDLFYKALKQEIEIIQKIKIPFFRAWNSSEKLNSSDYLNLIKELLKNPNIKAIYKSKENLNGLILRAFDRYLINSSYYGKIIFRKKLAKSIYNTWIQETTNSKLQITYLASLLNFKLNRKIKFEDFEIIPITLSGHTIKEIDEKLKKLLGFTKIAILNEDVVFEVSMTSYFLQGVAIRIKESINKNADFYKFFNLKAPDFKYFKKINILMTLLRLFKPGDVKIGSHHVANNSSFNVTNHRIGNEKYSSGTVYSLTDKKEIQRFKYHVKKNFSIVKDLSKLPNSIQIGIEYFNSSFDKSKDFEKFIDLMIAIDALLGINIESSYRISLRSAFFVTNNKPDRKFVYQRIKEAISLRNSLIHGNKHPTNLSEKERVHLNTMKTFIENIIRKIIIKLLSLYSKGELKMKYKKNFEDLFII